MGRMIPVDNQTQKSHKLYLRSTFFQRSRKSQALPSRSQILKKNTILSWDWGLNLTIWKSWGIWLNWTVCDREKKKQNSLYCQICSVLFHSREVRWRWLAVNAMWDVKAAFKSAPNWMSLEISSYTGCSLRSDVILQNEAPGQWVCVEERVGSCCKKHSYF